MALRLVDEVSVESAHLPRPAKPDDVVAIIPVHVKKNVLSPANINMSL